jgi:hypothetical protein
MTNGRSIPLDTGKVALSGSEPGVRLTLVKARRAARLSSPRSIQRLPGRRMIMGWKPADDLIAPVSAELHAQDETTAARATATRGRAAGSHRR